MALSVLYSAISAKVNALSGKMLSREDYQNIIELSSVQEIFGYLYNNTYYHSVLEKLSDGEVHRRQLELVLKKSFIKDYRVLYKYLTGDSQSFFHRLFDKFEIEDLKMLLRTILIEHDADYLQERLAYIGTYTDIDQERLVDIQSYKDLLAVFKNTYYYAVLERFADRYEENQNLFPIEMSLDLQYFSDLAKLSKRLNRNDYRDTAFLLGTQVDLLNIQWVYRIKKYYDLSPTEIMNYTLPFYYRISREEMKKLSRVEKAEEISKYISNENYRTIFEEAAQSGIGVFERYFLSYILEKSFHLKASSFFSIGSVISYLFIKEYEIRDIITIVEGIRYSLPADEIRKYVIREGV